MTLAQLQMRRGTAAQWTGANPVLASGEWGYETDTKKVKVGDGATAWNALTYFSDHAAELAAMESEIDSIGLRQIVTFTANGSFTKATYPWLKYVRVRLVGGGGPGGQAESTGSGQASASGGGGGGGYAEKVIAATDLGASENVTVGPGGTGFLFGSTSEFGAFCSATGGGPGADGAAHTPPGSSLSTSGIAQGGTGTGGDVNISGGVGGPGFTLSSTTQIPGSGGASVLSHASASQINEVSVVGRSYGGGGSGAANDQNRGSDRNGGDGAPGIVIVELYG